MKKHLFVLMMTLALLLSVVVTIKYDTPDEPLPPEEALSFNLRWETHSESIRCYQSRNGELLYVFLPSYAQLSQLSVQLSQREEIRLEGELLTSKTDLSQFQLNTPYSLTFPSRSDESQKLCFVRSGGVNTLFLDTESGSMEGIHADREAREGGRMVLFTEEGELDYSGSVDSIGGRGISSWTNSKKPYNLKLTKRADLLGMGSARKWVLTANAFDKTNLRNQIVFDMAEQMGLAATPERRYVDLYLNGEYAGLYLLSEKIEIDPERVNLSDSDGDITGGYLFTMQLPVRITVVDTPFVTEAGQVFDVKNPECSEAQLAYLSAQVQQLENAILAEDGIDPVNGKSWQELLDLDSWAKKYLIEEIFENQDAGAASQYFYKDSDSVDPKFYAGPVWDYDYSIGNGDISVRNPRCFIANRWWKKADTYTPWYAALYEKPEFYQRVTELYAEYLPALRALTEGGIDTLANSIAPASEMNRLRWLHHYGETQVAERTEYMRSFLEQRLDYLTSAWLESADYCTVLLDEGDGSEYRHYSVVRGEAFGSLPTPPKLEQFEFLGWFYEGTDTPADPNAPINKPVTIVGRWKELRSDVQEETAPESEEPAEVDTSAEPAQEDTPLSRRVLLRAASVGALTASMLLLVAIDRIRNGQNRRKSP